MLRKFGPNPLTNFLVEKKHAHDNLSYTFLKESGV